MQARKVAGRLVLSFGALALGLFAAEGLVRVRGIGPVPRPAYSGDILLESDDPLLSAQNRPGSTLTMRYRDRSGRTTREVLHHVNADGWRGPLAAREPAPGVLRIACVGDSHVFGMGVPEDGTLPVALERALTGAASGRSVEVLNFGVFGYRAPAKARLIETTVGAWNPDVVVMEVYIWESEQGTRRLARLQAGHALTRHLKPAVLERGRPVDAGWLARLRARSRLVDELATTLFQRAWMTNWVEAHREAVAARGPLWEATCEHVLRARDHARAAGVQFWLVLYPMLYRHRGELVSAHLGRALAELCAGEGIAFVDLHPAFERLELDAGELEALRIHPYDYHLTAEGHRIAAAELARALAGAWRAEDQSAAEPAR